nr:reverse transcriptase domain-containing protein [Tanacetum cinerariifolium]
MPFGLKNASATYQWMVDKAFDSQIGQNIKVYVDELVIKSHTEAKMLRFIGETFRTLRKLNMKLNPKKCTFGAVEGMFLGYMITPEGIKPCRDKTKVVLQLPSPRTIKEVQSLNGKLASLNRFLSKSAEKSLLLFKTLKKCIKKSDFHWTSDAEQAFKQLNQHLSKLPLLVAPKPKEELIVYLSASYGAISAVLMTERRMVLTPVYFVRYALQGPKLNYTLIEKLVLSLVFAAKRLRRAITKIKRYAGRTQYHIPAKDVGERTAQMGVKNVHISVDSKLVANQVLGAYIAKEENMIKYLEKVKSLVNGFTNFSINQVPRSKSKKADALSKITSTSFVHLSKQVLVEILKEKSIQEKEVTTVVEEDGLMWMTPIIEYLKKRLFPVIGRRQERSVSRLDVRIIGGGSLQAVIPYAVVKPLTLITAPWPFYKWGIDIASPFLEGPGKVKFLIVAMDYFTKWIEAKDVATITGNQKEKTGAWGKESRPAGTEAVIPTEIGMPTYRTAAVGVIHKDEELQINLDLLEERRERAAIREAKAKLKMTKYYNARVRGVTFRPGDFVYRSNNASHAMDGGKLGPRWEGPYEVTKSLGDGAYKLRSANGTVLPRTWNVSNLKKCYL